MAVARQRAQSTPAARARHPASKDTDRPPEAGMVPAPASAAEALLALQRKAGNAAVAALVSRGRADAAALQRHAGGGCACGGRCGHCAQQVELDEQRLSHTTPPAALRRLDRCAGGCAVGGHQCETCAEKRQQATSPPSNLTRSDLEEEALELTVPATAPSLQRFFGWFFGGSGSAPAATKPCQCVEELTVKGTGPIEGSFGIDEYWPGVTPYWGGNKTLGEFDTAGSGAWHTLGHKFQVVGRFSTKQSAKGGEAKFKQKARLGTTKGGTPGPWFDDMDYTDAGGGKHHWDPNAEAGTTARTGYPGVRRTIATDKYAYTDPPAIGYEAGKTDTYRDLQFDIHFSSAPDCPCGIIDIALSRSQEIEVKKGVPTVLKKP